MTIRTIAFQIFYSCRGSFAIKRFVIPLDDLPCSVVFRDFKVPCDMIKNKKKKMKQVSRQEGKCEGRAKEQNLL